MKKSGDKVIRSSRIVAFVAAGFIFLAALVDSLLFFGVTAGKPPNPYFFDFQYVREVSMTKREEKKKRKRKSSLFSWYRFLLELEFLKQSTC